MSTHAILPRITFCPPSPERPDMHFDRAQFSVRSSMPVETKYCGPQRGWESTHGISFDDYKRMGTVQRRRPGSGRRLVMPAYIQDARRFRSVIVRFLEIRVHLWRRQPGTEIERTQKVYALLKKKAAALEVTLTQQTAHFVVSTDEAERKKLQRNIIELDTQIRIYREPSIVPSMAKIYYCEGLRSNEVGERLGFKAPHVRQILYRLAKLDAEIQAGTDGRWYKDPESEAIAAEKAAKLAAEKAERKAARDARRAEKAAKLASKLQVTHSGHGFGAHTRYHVNRSIVSPKCVFCAEKAAVGSSEAAGNEPAAARPQTLAVLLEQQAERLRRRERKLEYLRQYMANKREAARTLHGKEKMTRAEVAANAGAHACHKRWHVSRGVVSPDCDLCKAKAA